MNGFQQFLAIILAVIVVAAFIIVFIYNFFETVYVSEPEYVDYDLDENEPGCYYDAETDTDCCLQSDRTIICDVPEGCYFDTTKEGLDIICCDNYDGTEECVVVS